MPTPSLDMQRAELARQMLVLGVRPHLVSHTLGLPQATMLNWYEELTNKRTPRGPLKSGAAAYVTSWPASRKLSVFLALYRSAKGADETPTVTHLISAITQFNRLHKEPINGTMAWLARRDYESGLLVQKTCSHCRTRYIYDLQTLHMRNCPFCVSARPSPSAQKTDGDTEESFEQHTGISPARPHLVRAGIYRELAEHLKTNRTADDEKYKEGLKLAEELEREGEILQGFG